MHQIAEQRSGALSQRADTHRQPLADSSDGSTTATKGSDPFETAKMIGRVPGKFSTCPVSMCGHAARAIQHSGSCLIYGVRPRSVDKRDMQYE